MMMVMVAIPVQMWNASIQDFRYALVRFALIWLSFPIGIVCHCGIWIDRSVAVLLMVQKSSMKWLMAIYCAVASYWLNFYDDRDANTKLQLHIRNGSRKIATIQSSTRSNPNLHDFICAFCMSLSMPQRTYRAEQEATTAFTRFA